MVEITVYLLKTIAQVLLLIVEAAMLLRALLSWIDPGEESILAKIAYYVSEPLIVPVRWVLDRFGLTDGLPIDISFMITAVLLVLLETIIFGL